VVQVLVDIDEGRLQVSPHLVKLLTCAYNRTQWRRQDLLRGGTKLESRSWGTHGGLQDRVQQLLDD